MYVPYLFQDIIKTFFPSGMSREFGSLHHLCEFEKTLLKKCEESDFNAICTILKLVTHSYIVALAENKLLSTANKNQLHADEKQRILEKISEEIVADIWPNVDGSSLDIVRQGNEPVRDGGNSEVLYCLLLLC